ncbi:Selenoprotein N [Sesbania bispinosa]|nr:Selenoprotein N [Sesbania bispinosa]
MVKEGRSKRLTPSHQLISCCQWHCNATRVQNEKRTHSLIHLYPNFLSPNKQVQHHVANRKWLWAPPASKSTLALAAAAAS